MSDLPDAGADVDFAEYQKPDEFEEDRQRRVDAEAKLVTDLGWLIQYISDHNSFPKADLIDTLKRAKRRIEEGFYGPW